MEQTMRYIPRVTSGRNLCLQKTSEPWCYYVYFVCTLISLWFTDTDNVWRGPDLIQGAPVCCPTIVLNTSLIYEFFLIIAWACTWYVQYFSSLFLHCFFKRASILSGSIPFILKEHLSYSQLATFALSGYPYSLKLLWSPIVDSVFFKSIGRRKSWIIPMQLIVGTLMLYISMNVQRLLDDVSSDRFFGHLLISLMQPANNVTELTIVFTSLVMFSATQGKHSVASVAYVVLPISNSYLLRHCCWWFAPYLFRLHFHNSCYFRLGAYPAFSR